MSPDARSKLISVVLMCVYLFALMIVMFTMTGDIRDSYGPAGVMLIFVPMFLAGLLLHIFVHELGHVIFGKLSGYEFLGMSVLGKWIVRTDGRLRIGSLSVRGAGGGSLTAPKGGYSDGTKYTMMIMGGTLMNVLLTAVFVIIGIMNISQTMNFVAWGMTVLGIYFILSNSIPLVMGFLVNDAEMLRLFRKEEASKHCMYLLMRRTYSVIIRPDSIAEPLQNIPADLPYGNRLADAVRVTLAEIDILQRDFDSAERRLQDLLDHLEKGSMASNTASVHLLFVHMMKNAGRDVIDSIYTEKMKKHVRAFSRMDPEAILFLVAYEKRFGTGSADIGKMTTRFYRLVNRSKLDTTFEKSVMESLLSERQNVSDAAFQ
jgi:hypothetical protein